MNEAWETLNAECAWQVQDLTTGALVGEHADQPLPLLSVAKVPIVLAMLRLSERGALDPARRQLLSPDGRSRGTTGISAMSDPVEISLRDAAYLALTISDNAAGDAVLDALGADTVARELSALGLDEIQIHEPMRSLYDRTEAIGDAAFDHPNTNTGTPRALIDMLRLIWTDQAATPQSCATLRDLMSRQAWRHRLASGFPATNIHVAGKTGTMATMRHEIGVVTYPGQRHYAAVFLTRSLSPIPDHRVDAEIGQQAKLAVLHLRRVSIPG